jgi:RHS repeat-associated protein
VVTNASGAILDDSDFYAYGGERAVSASSGNVYKFQGKERDTESGLDDFGARYYSSQLGRFISADWSAIPVPVPYADLTNPQTLNLYAIVRDNPETFADLDGHDAMDQTPQTGDKGNLDLIEREREQQDRDKAKVQNKNNGTIPGTSQPASLQPPKPPAEANQKTEYATPDAAGKTAVERINPQSVEENKEYAGWTVKNSDGTYSINSAKRGTESTSDPGPRPDNAAGEYHTHGAPSPLYDGEHFSPQDRNSADNTFHVPAIYLGTPSGKVLKYDVQTRKVSHLN